MQQVQQMQYVDQYGVHQLQAGAKTAVRLHSA